MRKIQYKMKILSILIAIGILCLFFMESSYAAGNEINIFNRLRMNYVNIELNEYKLNEFGEEVAWENNPVVMPGDSVSKITRITAKGVDCYVRAKAILQENSMLNNVELYGVDSNWTRAKDGYYYYREILKKDNSIDFFQGFFIPKELPEETQEQTFYLDVYTEAIQAENVEVDFDADEPWGNLEIEVWKGIDLESTSSSGKMDFVISYQGDSKQLIANQEDFFCYFPLMLPGSTYFDEVMIQNESEESKKLYFQTETIDDSILLDKLLLKISYIDEGEECVIYKGNLDAKPLNQGILLDDIAPHESGTLRFEVQVPTELKNEYTCLEGKVKWIFSTDEVISAPNETPATGDKNHTLRYLMCISICLLGIILLLDISKEEQDEEIVE